MGWHQTHFLRLLSVTTHSTWSSRQFVHGEPLSTTSHRTLRARQQQQAFEARRFTGRELAASPAVEALRLPLGSVSTAGLGEAGESVIMGGKVKRIDGESSVENERKKEEEIQTKRPIGEVRS